MNRFAYIENGEVKQVGSLPTVWKNVSNLFALKEDLEALKQHNWFPIETISENKEIIESTEYVIEENLVKEIITTRDRTQEEIDKGLIQKTESKWRSIRSQRDILLKKSDLNILPDKWDEMDSDTKLNWSSYRKQLRDIPQTFENPDDIIWPTEP